MSAAPGSPAALTVLAPAKVNLYLRVTGRRDDGYHTLDSLVCFADVGDLITIEPSVDCAFDVRGPFASAFSAAERDAGPDSRNLVVRAAWAVARAARRTPDVKITLTKNLPLAAGIGGGSADAAATVWALMEYWHLPRAGARYLPGLLLSLGADVPVCFSCQPTVMRGIGEILQPVAGLEEIPVVLANPRVECPTAKVFAFYDGAFAAEQEMAGLPMRFIAEQGNDLMSPAVAVVPEIAAVIAALEAQDGALFARLSGSGATCFGVFDSEAQAQAAVDAIRAAHPAWWVVPAVLNRVARY